MNFVAWEHQRKSAKGAMASGLGGWSGSDDEESLKPCSAASFRSNFFDTAGNTRRAKRALLGEIVAQTRTRKLYTATKITPKNYWASRRYSS